MRFGRYVSATLVFAAACGAHPTYAAEGTIAGLPNIEDMVVTSDQSWVIASSMVGGTQPQGALYLIDAKTSTPARIALTAADGTPRCPGGFQPSSLRSEEHTSERQSLMRISYAGFCLNKK